MTIISSNSLNCKKPSLSSFSICIETSAKFLEGLFDEKGVFPPELVGKHKACFDYFMKYLADRNIHYKKSVETFADKK